ncbi:DUF6090 family protein [Flavobacteriaceae bacterium KMM 6897]|nr:DUF6090 family protein [Flavobacteriaceae bacterium KMM 6897]
MLKFFRKIRQRLLSENKFSKYLIYAIGEIVLVVIGILIALQINNNNNYKAQRSVEQEYLLSLQTEFESNLNKINNSIQENERRIEAIDNLLTLFDKNVLDTINKQAISQMFFPVLGSALNYLPSKGVLSDIISSGKLNIILNTDLRQNLASFESSIDLLNKQLNEAYFYDESVRIFIFKEGSVRNITTDIRYMDFEHGSISEKVNNKLMFESVEFENYLLALQMSARATNGPRLFRGIKAQIKTILKEIKQDLEK